MVSVSVVIPCLNEEAYIGECLKSLDGQTEKPEEILVVDNGSEDKSVEIAGKFPVTVLHQKDRGIAKAIDYGFERAKGEVVAKCDADTVVDRDWVKIIRRAFDDADVVGVSGPVNFSEIKWSWFFSKTHRWYYFRLMKLLTGHEVMSGGQYAVWKLAWEKVRDKLSLNDDQVHEDLDLSMALAPYGEIKFLADLKATTSARRFGKLRTYWNYPYRSYLTLTKYRNRTRGQNGNKR